MRESIRVGVVGFGLAGRIFHTAVVEATPGLELASVVQRTGDEAAKAYPGAKVARSVEEMLGDVGIELVVIATPSYSHYELAKQCLHAQRNVVVDKPFTLTSAVDGVSESAVGWRFSDAAAGDRGRGAGAAGEL